MTDLIDLNNPHSILLQLTNIRPRHGESTEKIPVDDLTVSDNDESAKVFVTNRLAPIRHFLGTRGTGV